MQINLMHHPNAFASLGMAFDPTSNAVWGSLPEFAVCREQQLDQATAAYRRNAGNRRRLRTACDGALAMGRPGSPVRRRPPIRTSPARQAYADFQPSGRVYSMFTEPVPTLRRLASAEGVGARQVDLVGAERIAIVMPVLDD